eukprot:TRINITY_DN2553_c0_g1_i1.p1 TRINITY_DN2553_c0_g1~~TRINITY_DN2553_c0_g1_i1.p1  ORF type:complete len:523 (+),score=68.39 TRINITY_DN2553_c0_g1_i1:26-1570(+)
MKDGRSHLWLVVCFVLALSGCSFVTPANDPCNVYLDCPSCLYENITLDCGWCLEMNEMTNETQLICVTADTSGNGPNEGTCLEWNFYSCSDSKCLKEGTNCTTCTANPDCSWCDETVCIPSPNSSNPLSVQKRLFHSSTFSSNSSHHLLCESLLSTPESCFIDLPCASFNTCSTCSNQPHCGWCNTSSSCIFSLTPYSSLCPNASFFFSPDFCPNPLSCSDFTDCETCNDNTPDCRWCSTTNSKSVGTCLDPSTTNCSVPFSFLNCTFPEPVNYCHLNASVFNTTCISCTSQNISEYLTPDEMNVIKGCGYCDGACYPGNETNIIWNGNSSSCNTNNWIFDVNKCEIEQNKTTRICTEQKNCVDCLLGEGCGWCSPERGQGNCIIIPTTGRPQCDVAHWFSESCPFDTPCDNFETCEDCKDFKCWWCREGGENGKGKCSEEKSSGSCVRDCPKAPSPSPNVPWDNPSGGGVSGGMIALIVCSCGGFVLLVVAGFIGFWVFRKWKSRGDSYEILR